MTDRSRADLHVHSTASALSKLGVQRSLNLPECATPPQEVYELAKRRGMDFVTITDHDTIDGALELAHLPDTFISEELTVSFKDEPQAVHVLCLGIAPEDHEWLQARNDDVETCAAYVQEHGITTALAHPFYAVGAPLAPRHRRRLAQLFPIWETRNGSRAKELNLPAFVYIETHGGTGVGGSDDHAGIDVGRTFTATPSASTPAEFLAHIRAGHAEAGGDQGSAAKWAHAAMALAIRSLVGDGRRIGREGIGVPSRPDPAAVMKIVDRVLREGEARGGTVAGDLGPADALALLRAWLQATDIDLDERGLLRALQNGRLEHRDLVRRACRQHERKLADAAEQIAALARPGAPLHLPDAALALFDAAMPAIPYAASTAFLGREKARLVRSDGERPRVAVVADGIGGMHGVTHTLEEIRERGVKGFEVEIVGTDASVDRRLSAVAEIEVPFYSGLGLGVPSLLATVEALADGRYDLIHICAPGPAGIQAWLLARALEMPLVGSYHTELAAYASVRGGAPHLGAVAELALRQFYGGCDLVLSPSPASDARLQALGIPAERVARWDRGVDLARFHPALRREPLIAKQLTVLYAGRLAKEKGVEMLADAFLAARARDPRLHLALAGGGPEETTLRERLGDHATFLGWLEGEDLARAYASADMFLFASRTDTFGQVILEAQASGLPVIAVGEGGPASLIDHGQTGLLTAPEPDALCRALLELSDAPLARERLSRTARRAVAERSWESALERLATGYRRALAPSATPAADRAVV